MVGICHSNKHKKEVFELRTKQIKVNGKVKLVTIDQLNQLIEKGIQYEDMGFKDL